MIKLLRSTSVRLALIYALLLVVSSLTLVGLLWWHTVGYLDREIDAVIHSVTCSAVGLVSPARLEVGRDIGTLH